MHLPLLQLQVHALHMPGSANAQYTTVEFGILHSQIFPWDRFEGIHGRASFSPLSFHSGKGFAAVKGAPVLGAAECTLDGEHRCETITPGRKEFLSQLQRPLKSLNSQKNRAAPSNRSNSAGGIPKIYS